MFRVIGCSDTPADTLQHGENVFLNALKQGKGYYHVKGAPFGDYDIEYIKNNELVPENYRNAKKGLDIYPSYLSYDMDDVDNLDLSILKENKYIFFEELNEYSIVLGKLALLYTDAKVFYHDRRVLGFIDASDRLIITDDFPLNDYKEDEIIHVVDEFVSGALEANFHYISTMPLFHSVFFWQDLVSGKKGQIKYAEVAVTKSVGIGGVLSYYAQAERVFAKKGWITFLQKNASRYSDEMLQKYFRFSENPTDSDETNTIYVTDLTTVSLTYLSSKISAEIDTSVLSDIFSAELDEYAEAVLSDHNVLGILIRGTDYIASKMSGARKMATVDEMLPMIHEWIEEDKYDRIFLATEDQDILERMREEFGSMVIAISQERHRVSDFTDVKLISELEKKEDSGAEYEAKLEDNTVNYFYALYLLSKCKSFMVSGQCHGWTVVNSFNKDKFLRKYKFQVGVNKK